MKTITFYSYKGGVGRSLTLSNIATRLADLGKTVCIIDFDLEAPGLHLKFDKYIENDQIKEGLVDYITDFQNYGIIPEELDKYLTDIHYSGALNGEIKLIPAGNVQGEDYWKKLSSISWKDLFYSKSNDGIKLLLHLKELIIRELNPDFLLIDSRTGITDISGIAMTLLADSVVTLAANNTENISGTSKVIRSLLNEANNLTGKLPKVYFVLSRIPYYSSPDKRHIESRIIKKTLTAINFDGKLIDEVYVIHSDRELEEEEKIKINNITNDLNVDNVPIEEDYLILFEALTSEDLAGDEVSRFEALRESELLIEQAKSVSDNAIKIGLLKKAIDLNETSHEALGLIAGTYNELESYEKSLNYIEKAIKINDDLLYKYHKGVALQGLEKIMDAKKVFSKILEVDKKHYGSLVRLGNILYNEKKLEKALETYLKLTKYYSDYFEGYNFVGNAYRVMGDFHNAFDNVYKCLELNPSYSIATGTLAEIYAELGNDNEFYKNLQLAFVFGMTSKEFQSILNEEKVYKKYFKEPRFNELLRSYRIKVTFPEEN